MTPNPSSTDQGDPGAPISKGDQSRQKVLEAAHKLFLRQGFHGTSMRQIATESGLALAGIYNHFADKDALFTAVLDAYHPYRELLVALETDTGATKTEYLRSLLNSVRGILKKTRADLLPLAFTDLIEFQGKHLQALAAEIAPKLLKSLPTLTSKTGRLNVPDNRQVYLILFANIIGFMMVRLILGNRMDMFFGDINEDAWFDTQMEVCLRGLTAPKGPVTLTGRSRRTA